jgi:hypothetical protein
MFSLMLSSGLDLKENFSSFPLISNVISPPPTLMCALAVLRNGHPRISETLESRCISNTTKSIGTKNSRIFTGTFSAIPDG